MATYPGMNLSGEIRESISLDEDDLSDVEDEVFIRDGKARFKYSEDIGLKRPLMAPRRKLTKPDFKSRLRNRPPCRPYCKPCCYICGGLLVLIGLILLVIIIVSMFPLPIDKMKNWIVTKTRPIPSTTNNVLPCSELKVANIWAQSIPKIKSETSIRTVDINKDEIDDIIFGFGAVDSGSLPEEIFCPMFMNVAQPCGGGIIALDGLNGKQIWKRHLPYRVLTIYCTYDLNSDGINDCIVTGNQGMLLSINAKDGMTIWEYDETRTLNMKLDIYAANFVPDQDNDGIADILTSHTSQKNDLDNSLVGHLILISGKTGSEVQRMSTPNNIESFYIPQLLPQKNGQNLILFGTGSPRSSGNLTIISMTDYIRGNDSFKTIYEHKLSGVISPSILVDITNDGQLDIISAFFNTTIVAINGATFTEIWNVTVNNSETLSLPTPGFFNEDNVTDFLVKYQTGAGFPVYYYSQTFVIDGATGQVINSSRVVDSVGSQMGGLTLTTDTHGHDFFLYWVANCKGFEGRKDKFAFLSDTSLAEQNYADLCRLRFNSTKSIKLFALNQFEQPPGIEIYSSDAYVDIEYRNSHSALEEALEYLKNHPTGQVQTNIQENQQPVENQQFRHNPTLMKSYKLNSRIKPANNKYGYDDINSDTWQKELNYPVDVISEMDDTYPYDDENSATLFNELNNRDTRGDEILDDDMTIKKDLDANGIYGYKNIKQSRTKLLHDLNSSPTQILKDNYFRNLERKLRKSRFEQRDLKAHNDKLRENEDIAKFIAAEKNKAMNVSVNLWDLETEKEMEDRQYGYARGKRDTNITQKGIPLISSIGTLVSSLDPKLNAIDLIFLTYWAPPVAGPMILLENDIQCINQKLSKSKNTKGEIVESNVELNMRFTKECLNDRGAYQGLNAEQPSTLHKSKQDFPYYNEISQVSLGQMTVYRMRIECKQCNVQKKGERCAKFLNPSTNVNNEWSAYLNRHGDGVFNAL